MVGAELFFYGRKGDIFAVGNDDFLAKPFREEVLFEIMVSHLGIIYKCEREKLNENKTILPLLSDLDLARPDDETCMGPKKAPNDTDAEGISKIAELIKKEDPELAESLLQLAANFAYEPIRNALNRRPEKA